MRSHEIVWPRGDLVAEAKPSGGVAPLTPRQARVRQRKRDRALLHVADVQADNAEGLRVAKAKLSEV